MCVYDHAHLNVQYICMWYKCTLVSVFVLLYYVIIVPLFEVDIL